MTGQEAHTMGDIGKIRRRYDLEPLPEHAPVEQPAVPQPTAPDREPVPA